MDYANREVFPSSPLALVAAEVRFNDSPRLRQQSTIDAISMALESTLPVQGQQQTDLNVAVRAGGVPRVKVSQGRIMKDLKSTSAMTLTPDRMSFETTAYTEFSDFRQRVVTCCRALVDAGVTPALRRVGLRYIDEIRVPTDAVADAREWRTWIDARLVDHLLIGPADAAVPQTEGTILYSLGDRKGLNFRFAARPKGAVVSPATLVRRPFDADLPFFVLDLDGYQNFVGPDATLFSVEVVEKTLDSVHG
ncbi:MAG: TIGR04255 family protein, partial [Nocardioides sp.]